MRSSLTAFKYYIIMIKHRITAVIISNSEYNISDAFFSQGVHVIYSLFEVKESVK